MNAWEWRRLPIAERVERQTRESPSGCIEWTGSKNRDGYGQMKVGGMTVRVHRYLWEQAHGTIASGLHVRHRCDNPTCVNVGHMLLGTHTDNMQDKVRAGHSKNVPRGATHARPQAKITETDALDIKWLLAQRVPGSVIADKFGVSRNLVSEIKLGKTWSWL